MSEQAYAPLIKLPSEDSKSSDKSLSFTEQRILGEIEKDVFTMYLQQQSQMNSWETTYNALKDLSKSLKFSFPLILQCDSKQHEVKSWKCEVDKTQILKISDKNIQPSQDKYVHQLAAQTKSLINLSIHLKQEFIYRVLKLALKMMARNEYVPLYNFRCTENCSIYLPFGFISGQTQGLVEFPSIKSASEFDILKDVISFIHEHDKKYDCFSSVPMTPQHLVLSYIQANNNHPYYIAIIFFVFVLSLILGIVIFRYSL